MSEKNVLSRQVVAAFTLFLLAIVVPAGFFMGGLLINRWVLSLIGNPSGPQMLIPTFLVTGLYSSGQYLLACKLGYFELLDVVEKSIFVTQPNRPLLYSSNAYGSVRQQRIDSRNALDELTRSRGLPPYSEVKELKTGSN